MTKPTELALKVIKESLNLYQSRCAMDMSEDEEKGLDQAWEFVEEIEEDSE